MIVLSFLWDTFKLILKLPVLLCLGIIYSVVGMIRGIYSIFHAFYWVFLTLACNDTMDKYRVSHKINSTLKTYRLDSYFLSYHLKGIQYIGSNGESAHLGLLLYEFIRYNQSKIHPCITVLSF